MKVVQGAAKDGRHVRGVKRKPCIYKMDKAVRIQFIVWACVVGLLIGFLAYASHLGRLENSPYTGIHAFFKVPTWDNFRRLYADLAADPWGTVLLQFFFLTIPIPLVSMTVYLEFLLLKVSLYTLSVQMIAGRAHYAVNDKTGTLKQHDQVNTPDRVTSLVVVGFTIIVVLATHLIMALDVDDAKGREEGKFREKLSHVLGLNSK